MKKLFVSVLLTLSTVLAESPYATPQENLELEIKKGDEVAMDLIKLLGKNLQEHMKSEGAEGAAKFCSANALLLTQEIDTKHSKDIGVKRISSKYRNPANKPEKNEQKIMQALEMLQDNHALLPQYVIQNVDKETVKYYKPLLINNEVCLKCHGEIAHSKVGDFIKSRYPADKATGYKMGDLRGAIVITIKR